MLGLNRRVRLERRTGVRGGAPVYGPPGEPFPCRVETTLARSAGSLGRDGASSLRLYARDVAVGPGDRLRLEDGGAAIVEKVEILHGLDGVRHVTLTAEAERHG